MAPKSDDPDPTKRPTVNLGRGTPRSQPEPPVDPELATTGVQSSEPFGPGNDPPATGPLRGRYRGRGELLGEGGMGAVWLLDDHLIGRRVAMKVLRPEAAGSPTVRALFWREVRIQGQLEHPAIVPVYDVGVDPSGSAYFTMRRVRGTTLAVILEELRRGQPDAIAQYTPRRLLTAFASVCLAVDFAHQRGVVHRDLKPANLMLGDYGEIYILDWGVSRVLHEEGVTIDKTLLGDCLDVDSDEPTPIAGTPGYMAPEQEKGASVGPAADVYALGAILYELLTLKPLHHADADADASTPNADDTTGPTPGVREIRPERALTAELAAICVRALDTDPERRLTSARALHELIDRYLDGERNLELRRAMVTTHLEGARRLLEGAASTPAAHSEALRAIGRAIALEPSNPEALSALYALFSAAPGEPPDEVVREIAAQQAAERRVTSRTSAIGYASMVLFAPVLLWLGVRSFWLFGALFVLVGLAAAIGAASARRSYAGLTRVVLTLVVSTAAFALASMIVGPLVLVPSMIATNTMAFALHLDARMRGWAISIGCMGVVVPMALAAAGVAPSSYVFEGGRMMIRPLMVGLPAAPTLLFLTLTSVITIYRGARSAGEVRDTLAAVERRLYTRRWLLRQLVPSEAVAEPSKRSAAP